jgi:hypothetical protein
MVIDEKGWVGERRSAMEVLERRETVLVLAG